MAIIMMYINGMVQQSRVMGPLFVYRQMQIMYSVSNQQHQYHMSMKFIHHPHQTLFGLVDIEMMANTSIWEVREVPMAVYIASPVDPSTC